MSGAGGEGSLVEVALATCEGVRYLPKLLESLEGQTHRPLRVLVRDDASTDGTADLVRRWAAERPDRVRVLQDGPRRRLGPAANFGRILAATRASYVMPCDQDDVWRPGKVAVTLEAMRRAEEGDRPVVVHTDLEVVDAGLRRLGVSFWRYQNLRPELAGRFERTLVHNAVTGCAAMANRPLLERALPVPSEAVMHDWWLALVAAAFGTVVRVPVATAAYRQHGGNDTGARRWGPGYLARRSLRLLRGTDLRTSLRLARRQATAFEERFAAELSGPQREALRAFVDLEGRSFWGRRRALLEHRLLKHGLLRSLALLARV